MADDSEDGGLFAMNLSDSDPDSASPQKLPRDHQSVEDYEAQKASWTPPVEKGDLYKTLDLPISNPSKQQTQRILHAIEELYFFRRYEEAVETAEKALDAELQGGLRKVLAGYRDRARAKTEKSESESRKDEDSKDRNFATLVIS